MTVQEYSLKYDSIASLIDKTPFGRFFYLKGDLVHQIINLNTTERVYCYCTDNLRFIASLTPLPHKLIATIRNQKLVIHNGIESN